MIDYQLIIGVILLIISEVLPFIQKIPANGLLHSIKLFVTYLFVKCFQKSDLAMEIQVIKNQNSQDLDLSLSQADV